MSKNIDGLKQFGGLSLASPLHEMPLVHRAMDSGMDSALTGVAAMTRIEIGKFVSLIMPHGENLAAAVKDLSCATSSAFHPVTQGQPTGSPVYRRYQEELKNHPQTQTEDFWQGVEECGEFACGATKGAFVVICLGSILGIRMVRRLFGGRRRH